MIKVKLSPKNIAGYIDHTCVKIDATREDVKKTCKEAIKYNFHSVCVTPTRVADAKKFLSHHIKKISLIAVIGFPFGFTTTAVKSIEAKEAVANGATEIDMVININAIKDANWDYVLNDIRSVVVSVKPVKVKVIMETGLLTQDELFRCCQTAEEAGAAFVKTATGFGPRGAELHDITIMRQAVDNRLGIKASGGIHDFETAAAMIEAGADRIGSSSGLEIIGVKDKTYKKNTNIAFNY
jgi:deoxyribose-phosphate aldolase